MTGFRFGAVFPNANPIGFNLSDLIVMDTSGTKCNDLLGNRRVQGFVPTADGNYKEWTPSVGSDNYANVDEIPQSATDYNSAATAALKDSFAHGSISNLAASVDAAIVSVMGKTDDGGAASLRAIARQGTTDATSANTEAVPSSSGFMDFPFYVDPATGVAFTAAGFNSAEFGIERVS
jgi:hypothetical protein